MYGSALFTRPGAQRDGGRPAQKPKKKKTASKSGRAGATLTKGGAYFRTTYYTHLDLSRMADRKAHLMIGLNTFALSLVITKKHFGALAHYHYLLLPNLLLVAVCLTTIVLAIRITRPGMPPRQAVLKPEAEVNWVFFGEFCRYPLEVYHRNIWQLMNNEPALYAALSTDLHHLGRVLARKYRLLSRCYRFFFFGLLGVTAAYVAAAGWHFWRG